MAIKILLVILGLTVICECVVFLDCELQFVHSGKYTGYQCQIANAKIQQQGERILIGRMHQKFFDDSDVKTLKFVNSTINYIPQIFFDTFKKVRSLVFEKCNMKRFTRISNCSELAEVDVENNNLEEIDEHAVADCPILRVFNVKRNRLSVIRSGMLAGGFRYEPSFQLDDNPITVLENNFFDKSARNMKISCENCKINYIDPEFLDGLTGSITRLNLKNNECVNKELTNIWSKTYEAIKIYLYICFENFENGTPTVPPTTPETPVTVRIGNLICKFSTHDLSNNCEVFDGN